MMHWKGQKGVKIWIFINSWPTKINRSDLDIYWQEVTSFKTTFSITWPKMATTDKIPFHGPILYSSQAAGSPFWIIDVPGHVVTNKTSSPPLSRSCGLIPDMHLTNYYETEWINLFEIGENCGTRPFYQVGVTSACYIYQKIVILMIPHTNFWWFRTWILKCLMIPHTNFGERSCKFTKKIT